MAQIYNLLQNNLQLVAVYTTFLSPQPHRLGQFSQHVISISQLLLCTTVPTPIDDLPKISSTDNVGKEEAKSDKHRGFWITKKY